ncbi:sigma-70 family RNA polymerase sigma factor [Patiriisocius marinus]|uniref:RNA polymerase sigma factor SigZ n=1 Tax=Patiriisocius marinus TaxID=1397112 RepID=A0A5J4J369_9FLAO|nr:sigma-70 family RNA polymerase sigma factor [Patiriisocius marinus]GER60241.1 RNA polymerase sigma factor SigZ [Patiriisocius marinus]
MKTQNIWEKYNEELYFFILRKTNDKNIANDVFQNTFFKIHKNITHLKSDDKTKPWVFQIARNEIANYYNNESIYVEKFDNKTIVQAEKVEEFCCFETFINELPKNYKQVIELVYIDGIKQKDVAIKLEISLDNVKARIRKAKDVLKVKFNECCNYQFNKKGTLIGESNCAKCKVYD